jgi:hypothetical protein
MSNGEACCLLQVCCPPAAKQRVDEIAAAMVADDVCDKEHAEKIAEWFVNRIDTAFGGTLVDFLSSVATAVRENDKKHKRG